MIETKEITNISRYIQEDTTRMLWAVSAGMCEFRGCSNLLYTHHVTKENVNQAERAHIYAFSKGGKRYSPLLPRKKINDIDNLMLTCERCHKLIDSSNTYYSADDLLNMKKEHEDRVRLLISIKPDLQSEVVIYNCNIGDRPIRIQDFHAKESITPNYYPARITPINLSPDLRLYDNEEEFWSTMAKDLERQLEAHESSIRDKHISLFAVAPQPLLFKLGTLLNRNYNVSVRQTQGNVELWRWQEEDQTIVFQLHEVGKVDSYDKAAISIELTARLSNEEIERVFAGYRIFRIVANNCNSLAIKSEADLTAVMREYRNVLNRIRIECSADVQVSFLPIAPASVSIEAGRQLMKGDPAVTVYDRNYVTKEWVPALSI